jgi:tuftelin-interacting protein 11
MASWRPLEEPTAYTDVLRRWRNALKMAKEPKPETRAVDVYGTVTVLPSKVQVEYVTGLLSYSCSLLTFYISGSYL